jgi:hypothetical protein
MFGATKKINLAIELSKRSSNYSLLDLKDLYEFLSGNALQLAPREMLIYLILDEIGISPFKSNVKKSSIMEFKKNFTLYCENKIECDDITNELSLALEWINKDIKDYPCTMDLLNSLIKALCSTQDAL